MVNVKKQQESEKMSKFLNFVFLLLILVSSRSFAVTVGVEDAKAIARLYSAAFDRIPNTGGLNFWVHSYEAGRSLAAIARWFSHSPEFNKRYGALGDQEYVERLYENVLGRPGEPEGVQFWTEKISTGSSRGQVLAEFADSPENFAKTTETYEDMRFLNCLWVFGPGETLSGSTGCLVGPATSGIAYETPTYQGVTGAGGDFHYKEGEIVRFMIGDTPLGEVPGQPQVTLFDLAGSAVIIGSPKITEALANKLHPFNSVVNISVLLQSLDSDAFPGNGIEIVPEVAKLFQGFSLNVRQHWESFPKEFGLRHAMTQANNRNLFSKTHGIANPAPALQALYQTLGVDAQTLAVSLEKIVADEETDVRYEYDLYGNLARVTVPAKYSEGDETDQYLTQKYEYDAWGNRTRFEEREYSKFSFAWDNEQPAEIETRSIRIESRLYNDVGLLTQVTKERGEFSESDDPDMPGRISIEKRQVETRKYDANGFLVSRNYQNGESWQYQYGPEGELVRVEFDANKWNNSSDKNITTYQYDDESRPVMVRMSGTGILATAETLGIPEMEILVPVETYGGSYAYDVSYEYDSSGNVTRDIREGLHPSLGHRLEIRDYDANGKITRLEEQTDYYGDNPRQSAMITEYRYESDSHGNLVLEMVDYDGDGTPDSTDSWSYKYDNQGNILLVTLDRNNNGIPSRVWEYDADGYLIRVKGPEKTIRYSYAPTGWGHIFN
jgi:YD repeat-containing protein